MNNINSSVKIHENLSLKNLANEIFKDIPNYEGYYQVSNMGRVKSLSRKVKHWRGGYKLVEDKILKYNTDSHGYSRVSLYKNGKQKSTKVHQLVAEAFLNHVPCGLKLVINHINFNKTDNRVDNLEIVTNRENCNQKHIKSSSIFTGVYWNKANKKWHSRIYINSKRKDLGYFKNELDAHLSYEKSLKQNKFENLINDIKNSGLCELSINFDYGNDIVAHLEKTRLAQYEFTVHYEISIKNHVESSYLNPEEYDVDFEIKNVSELIIYTRKNGIIDITDEQNDEILTIIKTKLLWKP